MKYITVINRYTRKAVPFRFLENGEIQILSTDPQNDEDSCVIVASDIFYEYSHDTMPTKKY